MIRNVFTDANEDIVKKIESTKDYNIDGSLIAYIVQEYENQILEIMYDYCCNKKVIIDNDCVLCFDGIMIRKDTYYNNLLIELQEEIFNKIGINIKLLNKEMDEDYLHLLQNIENNDDEYIRIKEEFEKTHFKIITPISFADTSNGEIYVRNKTDMLITYQNKFFTRNKKKYSFIKEWMYDEDIKTYDRVDFYPDSVSPENIYNSFTCFEAQKKLDRQCSIKETLIYKHMCNLCNNNDKVIQYFEMFLSRKLKRPSNLTNTSLIFKSTQGVGKDTFFDYFGHNILGKKYYTNQINTDLLFGTFNGILQNKILVIIAESSSKKNLTLTQDIKDAITRKTNTIQQKGKEAYDTINYASYIFLTNLNNPIHIPAEDRRFVAIECNNDIANNYEYFKALRKEIEDGNVDRPFYNYLMSLDSDNFNFNDRPQTELYEEMMEAYKDVIIDFFEDLLYKERGNTRTYVSSDLFNQFIGFINQGNYKLEMSIKKFSMKLKGYEGIKKKRTKKSMNYVIDFNVLEQYLLNKGLIKPIEDII